MKTVELWNTREAAAKIGVTYAVLSSAIYNKAVAEPAFKAGSIRLWSAEEIAVAKRIFDDRDRWLGRTPRRST